MQRHITINANQLTTKKQFINVMATCCQFPSYFGQNLDAVDDCMRDLSWFEEKSIIIEFHNMHQLKIKHFAMYKMIKDTIIFWQTYWQQHTHKSVIFHIQ